MYCIIKIKIKITQAEIKDNGADKAGPACNKIIQLKTVVTAVVLSYHLMSVFSV